MCSAVQLSSSLQVTTYPYVGLLAFSGTRTRLVASVQGATGPQQLLQVSLMQRLCACTCSTSAAAISDMQVDCKRNRAGAAAAR